MPVYGHRDVSADAWSPEEAITAIGRSERQRMLGTTLHTLALAPLMARKQWGGPKASDSSTDWRQTFSLNSTEQPKISVHMYSNPTSASDYCSARALPSRHQGAESAQDTAHSGFHLTKSRHAGSVPCCSSSYCTPQQYLYSLEVRGLRQGLMYPGRS